MFGKMGIAAIGLVLASFIGNNASALDVKLEEVASGLQHPVLLTSPPEDDRRFIVEQIGLIKTLHPDGKVTPFLDIKNKMSQILCYETDSGVPNVLMTDRSWVAIRRIVFHGARQNASS